MEYIKITDGVYEEKQTPIRLVIKDINEQIDAIQAEKDTMVEPAKDELIEWGKSIHPFYMDKEKINTEIQVLRELKQKLISL